MLSFLPIVSGIWFGAYPVFIITSVLSALFDLIFVVMQRYNRQRVLRLLQRESKWSIVYADGGSCKYIKKV